MKTIVEATLLMAILNSVGVSHGQFMGGWSTADAGSEEILDAARKAVELYRGPGNGRLVLLVVYNASQQVVSGMKYRLDVKVGISSCPIKESFHRACFFDETMNCTFVIVVQAWLASQSLISQSCGNSSSAWSRIQTSGKPIQDFVFSAVRQLPKVRTPVDAFVLKRIAEAFKNREMDVYKARVEISINKLTVSRAELFLNASVLHPLLDCTTDSPTMAAMTRCRPEAYKGKMKITN